VNIITARHPSLKPLFEALGIQPNQTRRVVITITGTDAVIVNVETMLKDTQGQTVSDLISSHLLVERKVK
jgi:hypothetical protein